ncbi:hypothetical protein ACQJBY_055489 [Aegilops geniculata]
MGIGVVVGNHSGDCLVACNELFPGITEPELAEALAIRHALNICQAEGFMHISLVSDCLSTVNRIRSPVQDRSSVGVVVSDIKSLAVSFTHCTFSHVKCGLNVAAHKLARGCELAVNCFYRGVAPDCIRDELYSDVP